MSSSKRAISDRRRTKSGNRRLVMEPLESRIVLSAVRMLDGFDDNTLGPSDDASSGPVDIGFAVDFFGSLHTQLYVNNNGNVTFDSPLTNWTPDTLREIPYEIIAPFWADVDTRNPLSGATTYGVDTVDGRDALGVSWIGVGSFDQQADVTNSFQLVLIDRSDVERGAFDIELNYDSVLWDTFDTDSEFIASVTRAGFGDGSGEWGTFYELIGSGTEGAFLNSDPTTGLANGSLNSPVAGRYVFEVRDGTMLDRLGLAGQSVPVGDGGFFLGQGIPSDQLRLVTTYNADAADTTNTNQLWNAGGQGLALDGAGLTVGVWDGGAIRATHQEFGGRVTIVDAAVESNHATHVAGTIGASGVDAQARGMADQVAIRSREWTDDASELAADAGLIAASNHSYGGVLGWDLVDGNGDGVGDEDQWLADRATFATEAPDFGVYDANVRVFDQVLFDNPNLLSVWAAANDRNDAFTNAAGTNRYTTEMSTGFGGNPAAGWYSVPNVGATAAPSSDGNGGTGYDSLPSGRGQTAKNTLVVGAIGDITDDPAPPITMADMTAFSSWGPTDDGRIKPDVVANGDSLWSPVASAPGTNPPVPSDTSYGDKSGTSMAAPNTTGTAVLLQQHYQNLYSAVPSAATQKAVIIHNARDAYLPGPDYAFGWGLVDAASSADFLTRTATPAAGQMDRLVHGTYSGVPQTYTVDVHPGQPLKVTMVWTDPAGPAQNGLDNRTSVLVNDLDLLITGPGGAYFPWTLDVEAPATPAVRSQRNHLDNVEQVLVDAPQAGTYTIAVTHSDTLTNSPQAYSLLISAAAALAPDQFEPNDSIGDATVLGSEQKITLRDLTIHDMDDIDYFRVTASDTGELIVNALFEHDDGDLSLQIHDSNGNTIASANSTDDNEQLTIPVVGQQVYYVVVDGVGVSANEYALEIENFAAPPADFVDLPTKDQFHVLNDTGTSQQDNITSRTEPEILIEADLTDFADDGISILTAAQASAMDVPGAAVQVFVNGNAVGFADPIANTGNTLFRYTFAAGQLPVQVFPDDSSGWLHYVKAAVRIIDGQRDDQGAPAPATGRTQLSQPLVLVVDDTDPAGSAPDLVETSDSGVSNTDNHTNIIAPAFSGTAEHNARIRVFANGVQVGEGVAGTDLTDDVFDQVGSWEVTVEPLKYGQFEISTEVEDAAGNITRSGSLTIVVDPYEPNDTRAQSTILGSLEEITLSDVLLHNPDDVDVFKYTAHDTGKLIVNAFSGDDIALRVRDVENNIIATGSASTVTPGLKIDQLVIPVVTQEEYFIEIVYRGLPPVQFIGHVAIYDLELENIAAPIPDYVDLPAKNQAELLNDTGTNVFDDVTVRDEPEIVIEADLAEFHAEGITILDPADPDFGDLPGAAVEVFVNGNSVGFATEIPGTGHTLFRYVFTPGQLPETLFHADSGGNLHYVKAAVRIFDPQRDAGGNPAAAEGRTQLSEPLVLRVDTKDPTGTVPDMLDSSDTGWFNDDNVTSIRTPAFQGTAEHNAIIRIFATDVSDPGNPGPQELVGVGTVGSDLTEGDYDQIGAWEVTIEPLDDGLYEIVAGIEDLAGNISMTQSLRIEIDTNAPNTPLLDLLETSDSGRHNDDNITNDSSPDVTMTTHDANAAVHQLLYDDYLWFRIWDRFEGVSGQAEFLLYDSSEDAAVENVSVANDQFTSLTFVLEGLPSQFFTNNGANAVVLAPGVLADGIHNLKLEVEDRAGNVSADFLLDMLIDTQAFAGEAHLDPDSDTGVWGFPATMTDGITSDMTPSFFGIAEADNIVTVVIDGTPAGTAVAIPLDGDDAFQPPNAPYDMVEGNWLMETNILLEDGEHTAEFTFEDPAGNRVQSEEPVVFFVDSQGPKITNVTYGDISVDGDFTFNENTTSLFHPKPDGGPDPLISSIVVHFSDLPLRTEDFDYPALLEALAEEEGNYRVVGDANGNIPILQVTVTFDTPTDGFTPATATVELVFHDPGPDGQLFTGDDRGAPLPDDRYTLTVFDTLLDPAGNPLDGESGAAAPFEGNDAPVDTPPIFPTGDGQHGGDFLARFTVDSRPELGVWSSGSVYLDINGNFVFDPDNVDYANRDIVHTLGYATDYIFAGNFVQGANAAADGFDKLAAYGNRGGSFRWLIDFNNDGVPDATIAVPAGTTTVGTPVAGDFDGNAVNGDEVGLFNGTNWVLDTNHDFVVDLTIAGASKGLPFVGDFDGDGVEDLGTLDTKNNRFSLDLGPVYGTVDASFQLSNGTPFIGPRERPVAADMDGDGIDDIGLWVPDRSGIAPEESGEWFFIVSGGQSLTQRIDPGSSTVDFTPTPFGNDMFAQFGDEFAIPVVGNFDPPTDPGGADGDVTKAETVEQQTIAPSDANADSPQETDSTAGEPATTFDESETVEVAEEGSDSTPGTTDDTSPTPGAAQEETTEESDDNATGPVTSPWQNPVNPLDVNVDGYVTPLDVLIVAMWINEVGSGLLIGAPTDGDGPLHYVDTNGDGQLAPVDTLLVINYIEEASPAGAEGEGRSAEAVTIGCLWHDESISRSQDAAASPLASIGGGNSGVDASLVLAPPSSDDASPELADAPEMGFDRDTLLFGEDFSTAGFLIDEIIGDLAADLAAG